MDNELFLFGDTGDPLSNFAYCDLKVQCPFCHADIIAKTVEHAFQAAKAINCADYHKVVFAPGPGSARDMGKNDIRLRPDWDKTGPSGRLTTKADIMLELLKQKYAKEPFYGLLLATGDKILIERAPWDRYWGAGPNGKGKNALGRLLMVVRADLNGRTIDIPGQTPFIEVRRSRKV